MIRHYKNLRIISPSVLRSLHSQTTLRGILDPLQSRSIQTDYVLRDPQSKPIRCKYPTVYDPYSARPPPSDKIVELAEQIAALPLEEREMIGPTLTHKLNLPKLQRISTEGMDVGPQGGPGAGAKTEEKKVEKTAFDVKLEKFDDSAKIKVLKEVRAITNLGLKEAKDLVMKAPAVIKQGVSKEEATAIIDKIKAAGGGAVME